MKKRIVQIKGMHCRSCEIVIGQKLKKIAGVNNVHVSWKNKQAIIYSSSSLNDDVIKQAVFDAGYSVGYDDSKHFFSRNTDDYVSLIFSLVVIYFIFTVAKALGYNGMNTGGSNPSSLLVVLMVGLTAGISTCMALVGGLVLGISARHSDKHPEATTLQKFRPHLFFNLGRILSYLILGGLLGVVGKAFQLNSPTLGIITIGVGIIMLTLGLQLTEIFPKLSNISLTLPSSLSSRLGLKKTHEKEYSHTNSILAGALTFFLPCGFTQAMQLFAISSGSFWQGAAILGIFAIGTAPGLLGIGGLTSILKGSSAKRFFKFTGALVLILAFFNISNGFNLTGWKNPFASTKNSSVASAAPIENGFQIIKMDQSSSGYSPKRFTIQKDIPVKWIVTSKGSGSCSSSIFMSEYNIKKALKAGENTIEFTPTETGNIKFTCSMGMFSGNFNVIEKLSQTNSATPTAEPTQAASSPGPTSTASRVENKTATPTPASNMRAFESNDNEVQVIKTTYKSNIDDISPSEFKVKVGKKVRMEVTVQEDGRGCMSTIMIPGLVDQPELLEKGKTIVFEFTAYIKEKYQITCAMGVPRGTISVE